MAAYNKANHDAGGTYGLLVQAYVRTTKGPIPIHVQNYDNLSDVGVPTSDPFGSQSVKSLPIPGFPSIGDSVVADTGTPVQTPDVPSFIGLRDAKPGYIDLANTAVDRGSVVEVVTTLYKQNQPTDSQGAVATPGTTAPAPTFSQIDQTTRDFEVERLGLSYTLSANAIFVNQLGRGPSTRNKQGHLIQGPAAHNFLPAAGASLTAHYRPRWSADNVFGITDDKRLPAVIWDTIDPGIGLNVSALNATDLNSSTHLGLGLGIQGSFFHDVLQVGYGYDLTEGTRPQYWYVGIGVLETLNQLGNLGLTIPGSK